MSLFSSYMPGMLKDGVGRRRMATDDGCRWMILTDGDLRHCIFLIHRLPAASGVLWWKLVDAKVFWGIHRIETENLPDDDGEMPESTDFRWMNTEKPPNDGTKRVTSTDFHWMVDGNLADGGGWIVELRRLSLDFGLYLPDVDRVLWWLL
ncbi:hypothetical protein B0H12DRAFT_1068951 [Mycena haematopus]|nr:hypothetical protein B0H12DRAFT_1068951 [Mycena haematopus]